MTSSAQTHLSFFVSLSGLFFDSSSDCIASNPSSLINFDISCIQILLNSFLEKHWIAYQSCLLVNMVYQILEFRFSWMLCSNGVHFYCTCLSVVQVPLTVSYRLNQVNPVHSIYYHLLYFDTWEENCGTSGTLLHLQLLSVATLSLSFYKLLVWCVGLHIFYIEDWQHPHTLYWLVAQYSAWLTATKIFYFTFHHFPKQGHEVLEV